MIEISPSIAAILGALIGVLGSYVAARWVYLATATAASRKERIAQIQVGVADILSTLQVLAFSCRQSHKTAEEEVDIYERARLVQSRLLVLLDTAIPGADNLIDSIENTFGMLKKTPPPTTEAIAFVSASILANGKAVIDKELQLLSKGK